MDLGGDLAVIDASLVFQLVNMARLTGVMKFIAIDNVARFYFKEGELIYATIEERRKRIGDFLVEREIITREQLSEALEEYDSTKGKRRIGRILIDRDYLDFDTLVTAIQDQMKDVVYEAIRWKKGQFIFFNNVPPEDREILLDVKMDHLILEGLKRLDEARNDDD
jgi:hypothetical protein